jgi:hypothetical protein
MSYQTFVHLFNPGLHLPMLGLRPTLKESCEGRPDREAVLGRVG